MAANLLKTNRTMKAISKNLDLAVAFYETFVPTGQDGGLIDRVNAVEIYPAFNIISDALHINSIMALCRIWDTRRDTANLNFGAQWLPRLERGAVRGRSLRQI
jgi:hypothetical protein